MSSPAVPPPAPSGHHAGPSSEVAPASAARRADAVVAACYLAALVAAALVVRLLEGNHPIVVAAVADLAATAVVFAFSVAMDNTSMYDPYWSVAPLPLVLYFAAGPGADPALGPFTARAWLVIALLSVWGARLTWNWRRGWRGLRHEDWRYVDFRRRTGLFYWPVSLLGLHLFPTVQVFLGMVPAFHAATSARPLGLLDGLAALVGAVGVFFEWVADRQLHRFRATAGPRDVLTTGLWASSRHPNYFGELCVWWSVALFGLAGAPDAPWLVAGALLMTAMFVFISVPLIDRRMLARRPAYAERVRTVSAIVPWPFGRRG